MNKNKNIVFKTLKNETKKRYTLFQILFNGLKGNKNLNSELFQMKKKNNIQKKKFDILKLFSFSKKEKKWVLFCSTIVNLSYVFLWETFADEYQMINDNNAICFWHLFFAFSLIASIISVLFFCYECDHQ